MPMGNFSQGPPLSALSNAVRQLQTSARYMSLYRDRDIVLEILQEAQGNDGCQVPCQIERQRIVLKKRLDVLQKYGYKTEIDRPVKDDDYFGITKHLPTTAWKLLTPSEA